MPKLPFWITILRNKNILYNKTEEEVMVLCGNEPDEKNDEVWIYNIECCYLGTPYTMKLKLMFEDQKVMKTYVEP